MIDEAILELQKRARRYVYAKGWIEEQAEDLVSEMVLAALAAGDIPLNMRILYGKARDALHGRTKINGEKQWQNVIEQVHIEPCDDQIPDVSSEMPQLSHDPYLRQNLANWPARPRAIFEGILAGKDMQDIATTLGISSGRVSQIIKQWRPQLQFLISEKPLSDTLTITCPVCAASKKVKVFGLVAPLPIYCSRRCLHQAQRADRPFDASWRKYTFTEAMNITLVQTLRTKRFGALKDLWRNDVRFHGIPYPIMKRQARELGILRSHPRVKWTAEEGALLHQLVEKGYATETMVKKLRQAGFHRTPNAIQEFMYQRQWVRPRTHWTMLDVARGLGCDHHVIQRWIKAGRLLISSPHTSKSMWRIATKDLIRFIKDYPEEVAKGTPDVYWLLILLGAKAGHVVEENGSTHLQEA